MSILIENSSLLFDSLKWRIVFMRKQPTTMMNKRKNIDEYRKKRNFQAKWKENFKIVDLNETNKKRFTKNIIGFCTRAFVWCEWHRWICWHHHRIQKLSISFFINRKCSYFVICWVYGRSVILIPCVMGKK